MPLVRAPLWRGSRIQRGRYWGLGQTCGDDPACVAAVSAAFAQGGSSTIDPSILAALQGPAAGPDLNPPLNVPGLVSQVQMAKLMSWLPWVVGGIGAALLVAAAFGGRR